MSEISNNKLENTLDIIEIIKLLWNQKIIIISITSIFAIFSVFYALSIPNQYQSSALLKVNNINNESSGGLSSLASQYGGLASMAGLSIPSSGLDSGTYAMNVIKSREFAKHLMSFNKIKQNLMATKSFDLSQKKIIYNEEVYDRNKNLWVREPSGGLGSEPSYLEVHETALKKLEVAIDDQTGLITISFEHYSPIFAQELVSIVISEVNKVTREIKLKESNTALDYLKNETSKVTQKDLKNNINVLIQKQLNEKMLASVKEDYLLSIIDSPIIPEYKSNPKRARICILITLLGGIISLIASFLRHIYFIKK